MKSLPNDFQIYEFSPDEFNEAVKLNPFQEAHIQTVAGQTAQQLLNTMMETDLEKTRLQVAYLTGQFQILKYLLELNDASKTGSASEVSAQLSKGLSWPQV